ncbi:hypothetical protein D9M71_478770 [compost metagenome]
MLLNFKNHQIIFARKRTNSFCNVFLGFIKNKRFHNLNSVNFLLKVIFVIFCRLLKRVTCITYVIPKDSCQHQSIVIPEAIELTKEVHNIHCHLNFSCFLYFFFCNVFCSFGNQCIVNAISGTTLTSMNKGNVTTLTLKVKITKSAFCHYSSSSTVALQPTESPWNSPDLTCFQMSSLSNLVQANQVPFLISRPVSSEKLTGVTKDCTIEKSSVSTRW